MLIWCKNYPHSVSPEYLRFILLANFSSVNVTAMSFLSTQALFIALGSTVTQANVGAAAFTWVLKDGIGQFGGILFASRYGKNFDENIKKWRYMSSFAINSAIYIEIMTL